MELKGFVGPSYRLMSPRLGCEETVNLYLETHQLQGRKKFNKAPGLKRVWGDALEFPVSFMLRVFSRIEVNPEDREERVFALIGDTLYELTFTLDPVPALTIHGTPITGILSNGGRAYVESDPADTQLVFVTDRQMAYKVESASLSEINWMGVPVTQVAEINNFFLFLSALGDGFFFSEPGDGSSGDPLNFVTVEGANTNWIAIVVDRNVDIWVFGSQSIQLFYNDRNDPDDPFKPNQSAFMECGIAGPNLACAFDNRVFWIDENYIVRASKGYLPDRISTFAVENELRTYGDISNGYVWTATWNGHNVIRWTFPTPIVDLGGGKSSVGMTWQYDATENDWTRVLSWDDVNGTFLAHRGMSSCEPIYGKQLVGDRENGRIYIMSPDVYLDDCRRIPWLRRAPILETEGLMVSYPWFELAMMTGINPVNAECAGDEGGIVESYNIPFAMNFSGPWIFADGEETDYTSTQIYVDPDDFDGTIVSSVFYAVSEGGAGSISLVHSVDGELARLEWFSDDLDNLFRIVDFVPSTTAGYYFIRMNDTSDECGISWMQAVIAYRNPTKFWVDIPLVAGDASTGGGVSPENDLWSYTVDTYSTTYEGFSDNSSGPFNIWEKDSTKWDEIDKFQVAVNGWSQWDNLPADADVAYIALFNKTDDVMVTGSELTFDEIVPTTKTADLENTAENFSDGDEFEFRIKCDNATGAFFSRAAIRVHVINYRQAEVRVPVNNILGSAELFGIQCRSFIDPEWFPVDSTYTYELTGIGDDMDESLVRLQKSPADYGNVNAVGTPGAIEVIQGEVINPDSIISPASSGLGYGLSDTAAEQIIVELTDFTWNTPVVEPILNASVIIQGGPYDQTAAMAAKLNSEAYISHSEAPIEFVSGIPSDTYIYNGLGYDFGSGFTASDFDNPVVRLRATQPGNTTETQYHWRAWTALFVLSGDPVVELDFTTEVDAIRLESDPFDLDEDATRWFATSTNVERAYGYIVAQTENPNPEDSGIPITEDPTIIQETDPLVTLRYSNNWGQNWSSELYRTMGREGDYGRRMFWPRLGSGRQRVFEVSGSAAVPVAIDAAYIADPEVQK